MRVPTSVLHDDRAVELSPDDDEIADVEIAQESLGFPGWFDWRVVACFCHNKLSQKNPAVFECVACELATSSRSPAAQIRLTNSRDSAAIAHDLKNC